MTRGHRSTVHIILYDRSHICASQVQRNAMVDDRYTTNIKMGNTRKPSSFPSPCNTEQSRRFEAIRYDDMYPVERTNIERNHSDVPQGDEIQHMTKTMNSINYKPYNSSRSKLNKINRNESFVNFGAAQSSYESTTDSSYTAIGAQAHPQIKLKTRCNKVDIDNIVPLPYTEQYITTKPKMSTITMDDFDHKTEYSKLKLDDDRLNNLRCSHIFRRSEEATTVRGIGKSTQDDLYRPPSRSAFNTIQHEHDPGWLQRSNVPLGTLGNHISGCHKGWY